MTNIKSYPFITGENTNSFAYFTITQRLPHIIEDTIQNNTFDNSQVQRIEQLSNSIPDQTLQALPHRYPYDEVWDHELKYYSNCSWLEVPFFLAENYFYRRLLEAIDYFDHFSDPFATVKKKDSEENIQLMTDITRLSDHLSKSADFRNGLEQLILINLWGNQADLSQLHWDKKNKIEIDEIKAFLEDKVVINNIDKVQHLLERSKDCIDIILDNAGLEIFTDLILTDYLLQNNKANQVRLHAKKHPTFVSDTTKNDLQELLKLIKQQQTTQSLALRIEEYVSNGQLKILDHVFWNLPLYFHELPPELSTQLNQSGLIIIKGDAQYRRLLGDRAIPFTNTIQELVDFAPAPLVAIRSLKSEIICGLQKEEIETLNKQDPDWLTNGNFGIIQYCASRR